MLLPKHRKKLSRAEYVLWGWVSGVLAVGWFAALIALAIQWRLMPVWLRVLTTVYVVAFGPPYGGIFKPYARYEEEWREREGGKG